MPKREDLISQVASQMMKSGKPGKFVCPKKHRDNFEKRHTQFIRWALYNLPRCSTAVHAVVVKCLIKYDFERVDSFCKAIKNNLFEGQNDPAHLLWQFLQRHRGPDTSAAYWRTVAAAKAYMENKPLKRLTPAKTDIFEWDESWTVPDECIKNWNPEKFNFGYPELQDCIS